MQYHELQTRLLLKLYTKKLIFNALFLFLTVISPSIINSMGSSNSSGSGLNFEGILLPNDIDIDKPILTIIKNCPYCKVANQIAYNEGDQPDYYKCNNCSKSFSLKESKSKKIVAAVGGAGLIGAKLWEKFSGDSNDPIANSVIVHLKDKDAKTTPIPFHYLPDQFKEKVHLLKNDIGTKKVIIDCALFGNDTIKLISEILTYEAGAKFIKNSNVSFSLKKIKDFLQDNNNNKRAVIEKAQHLLRALKFFKVNDNLYDPIYKECKSITGCKKKELLFLQEDLLEELEDESIYSLGQDEKKYRENAPTSESENHYQELLFNQFNLSPINKRKIAFYLLKRRLQQDPYTPVVEPYVIDNDSWQDLEIVAGSGSTRNTYFAASIDQTYSELAKVSLYLKLLQPTDNIDEIEKNKKIIKLFLDKPELFKDLDLIFKEFFNKIENENGMLSFFHDRGDYFKNEVRKASWPEFLPNKFVQWLNSNEISVSFWNAKEKISLWFTERATKPVDYIHSKFPWFSGAASSVLDIACYIPIGILYQFNPYKASLKISDIITKQIVYVFNKEFGTSFPTTIETFLENEISKIAGDFILCLKDQNHRKSIVGRVDVINCLYEKLFILSKFINSANQVHNILKEMPELQNHLPCLKALDILNKSDIGKLDFLLNETRDPASFEQFMHKLGSNIFEEKNKAWTKTHFGRIIATYYLVSVHKEKLFDIYMALCELDVYLSMVRLYNKHKGTTRPFCFVDPIVSDEPVIDLEGLWNPMLKSKAVSNDIALGCKQNSKDAIITGPNEGGKSTLLRNIVFAMLMVKMGLCPAKKAVITPFSNMRAYLNITDDAAHDRSLFRVSTERANELINVAGNTHSNGPSLVLFDELYNGTKPSTGEGLAYGTLKYLNQIKKFPRNICIASTHYPCVAKLRAELDTDFVYLRVCDKSDGKENRFKVLPGIYRDSNGFEVAESANVHPEILRFSRAHFEQNIKDAYADAYKLYLGALSHKEIFDDFISKLDEHDIEAVNFFHKITLIPVYCKLLFKQAESHGFNIKKLINYQDAHGRTILHHIAINDIKDQEFISFLIEHGAKTNLKDVNGYTPVDHALYANSKTKLEESLNESSE